MMRRSWVALAVCVLVATACSGGGDGTTAARQRLGAANPASASPAATPSDPGPAGTGSGRPDTAGSPAAAPVTGTTSRPESAAGSPAAGPLAGGTPAAPAGPSAADHPVSAAAGGRAGAGNDGNGPGAAPGAPPPGAALPPAGGGDHTGVSASEVLFGMHLPQSGPVGVLLGNAWKGAQAYFDEVNAAGGVNGRRVKMIVADDGYSADKAAGAIRELVDTKKVFAASCLAGVDQCVVGLDYANAKAVPYVCAGMSEAAVANRPWAFPDTTSYAYAGSRLVDYLFTKRGFTPQRKIGALYLNSVHISEAVDRMSDRLKSFGARFVVKVPAEKDQSDFSTGITKLANAGVDTLWWFVDPSLIAKFTAQAKLLRYTPQYVFFAPAGGDLFAEATGGNLDGAYGLSGWADPQWPGGAAFRETFKRSYPDQEPTDFTVVAYIHARLLVEGLRRAGPDLGRDAFARGLAGLDRLDTGISSPISYSTRSRLTAANGALALFEIHGTHTDQVTGFDF